MLFKKPVLCLGKDRNLLNSRTLLLDKLFQTTAVMSVSEMEGLASAGREFELVVFCHTLSSDECLSASAMTRQRWPQAKILGLTSINSACEPPVTDANVAGQEGPAALLKRATGLLQNA